MGVQWRTSRSGRTFRKVERDRECGEDEADEKWPDFGVMCPICVKPRGAQKYVPLSFCDMIGLADRVPDLTEGASRWLTALEVKTAGLTLALGDIKALLIHISGKHTAEEIFVGAELWALAEGNSMATGPSIYIETGYGQSCGNIIWRRWIHPSWKRRC